MLVLFASEGVARDFFNLGGTHRFAPWFQVQEFQLELTNGDEADLYAPRVPPRRRGRYVNAFGMVTVLQGALVDKSQYRTLGRELAQLGLVVVVPNHLRSFPGLPFPVLFSELEVVTAVYETLLQENEDTQSPLEDLIDDLDTSMAPVALVQGSLDGVSTPAEALASYPNLEQPRALITIHGANHYGITDDMEPPGASPDPLLPTLKQRVANLVIARWTGHWLRAQLLDDPRAQFWIYGAGGDFSGIVDVTTDCPRSRRPARSGGQGFHVLADALHLARSAQSSESCSEAGCTTNFIPSAWHTRLTVSKRGCAPVRSALYSDSRASPEAAATSAIPLLRAATPSAWASSDGSPSAMT